ncbi:MAG: DUF983 domain-containing protein [Alphaproteobacteria bacterium]|nr:DUF983 domain-containing protein [Alphaproteobacteria bacterium]
MPATSSRITISASRRRLGTGTSSTSSGCSCSSASTGGAANLADTTASGALPHPGGGRRLFGEFSALTSVLRSGLLCRCPQCGRGKLFDGVLTVAERCAVCGLDLKLEDSGDGPAVFAIFIVGFVIVGLALWLELVHEPPLWLHMLLWTPLTLGLSLALLRPLKATLIALQFRHKAGDREDRGWR